MSDPNHVKETAILCDGDSVALVGVITQPSAPSPGPATAVLLLNAGMLHHVGPNRLYVELARALAALGLVSVRFDFSGLGDSPPRTDQLALDQSWREEAALVMDRLQRDFAVDRFVLCGICSGADAALATAMHDRRVVGTVLINGELGLSQRSRVDQPNDHAARTALQMRYYSKKLRNWRSVGRLVTLRSDYRHIMRTVWRYTCGKFRGSSRHPGQTELPPVAERLLDSGLRLFVVYSEGSEGLDLIRLALGPQFDQLPRRFTNLHIEIMPAVDHVFTPLWAQDALVRSITNWCQHEIAIR